MKLEKRIAVAYSNGCYDKVDMLQNTLIHSFYARALAVKIVTSNRGKYTSGVDDYICDTDDKRYQMIFELSPRGYKPLPLKRIYIPKANGQKRPLSIPTIKDRAMQTLYKFALEPIAEITADDNSFAFRPKRSAKMAVSKCIDILEENPECVWILKLDIKSCFDTISHKWIMDHIPMDKKILRRFIECGFVDGQKYAHSLNGVPQGGCLSSVICNMTLDGIEKVVSEPDDDLVRMVRYADDLILFGVCPGYLVQSVLPRIQNFLSQRGLQLSMEKTALSHIDNGITFLGYEIRRKRNRFVAVPKRKNIDNLLNRIRVILQGDLYNDYVRIDRELNNVIRGWFQYYLAIAPIQTLYCVENEIIALLEELREEGTAGYFHKIFDSVLDTKC